MFRLMMITSRRLRRRALSEIVADAVAGGVDAVQVREKDLNARHLFHLTRSLIDAVGGRARVIVNDRLDVALATGAQGVHLSAKGIPVAAVRAMVPKDFVIGYSSHRIEEAEEVAAQGADYVTLSPIYRTGSKKKALPLGIEYLCKALGAVKIPVVALGGVSEGNIAELAMAGVPAIAVVSAISGVPSPRRAAARLLHGLTRAPGGPPE
jgi:thiamine-phosphate pyrophosphorylase